MVSLNYTLKKEMDENKDDSDNELEVKNHNNHIYFYSDVNNKSAQQLNIKLKELEEEIIEKFKQSDRHKEYIYLHINSYGGSVFSAFSIIDTIKNLKVPVVSIIEGTAASAATLISVVCEHRIIYKTSYMLIHQLTFLSHHLRKIQRYSHLQKNVCLLL